MPIPQEKKFCGMGPRARPSYFCKRSIDDLGRSTISVLDAEPIYVGCEMRTLPLHRNNNLDDVSAIVSLATQIVRYGRSRYIIPKSYPG
ncbi:hypothetical protein QUB70_01080 [Microcoleus sp. A003_D6]|uniref:hypothetical protein n=1 Tax=Microcoleus sp. A003_D6 TaxID=3055266 RepID=UPI002FD5829E